MKIYETREIPTDTKSGTWVHYMYCDESGWIYLDESESEMDLIAMAKIIISKMELDSALISGGDPQHEISGYSYDIEETNNFNIITAKPYRGEETTFIFFK